MSPPKRTAASRSPLREAGGPRPYMSPLSTPSHNKSFKCEGDRFIPYRGSATDMDIARYLLTEPRKDKEKNTTATPSKGEYRKLLAQKVLNNRTRILAFRNKPPEPDNSLADAASIQAKPLKKHRYIPQVCMIATHSIAAHSIVKDTMVAQARGPLGCREGTCVVPIPEQPTGVRWWHKRSLHQVLEHANRSVPQLCRHRFTGVRDALEQE